MMRARLGVLTCLVTHPKGLPFPQMKKAVCAHRWQLNRHLQVLQEALLVSLSKRADRERPQTLYPNNRPGAKALSGLSRGTRTGHPTGRAAKTSLLERSS